MDNKEINLELKRFNDINSYARKLMNEQKEPLVPPTDPAAAPVAPVDTTAPVDPYLSPEEGTEELPPEEDTLPEPSLDDTTEEIDITDLVNMTKNIKQELENSKNNVDNSGQKMDDIFSKLNDLELKLSEMDTVMAKIDQLGAEIQNTKPKTPIEKLEMRSLDSYPFNKKPDEFFAEKQQEMIASGKNEYSLTKGDVENYGKYEIMKSFNPNQTSNY